MDYTDSQESTSHCVATRDYYIIKKGSVIIRSNGMISFLRSLFPFKLEMAGDKLESPCEAAHRDITALPP